MKLTLCPRCHRHVKASEPCCPFCGTTVATVPGSPAAATMMLGIGLVVSGCGPLTNSAYGTIDASPIDASTRDAIQSSPPCPDKTAVEEYGDCAAAYVGMTCPGTAVFCGQAVYTDCACETSTPHTWFCGERSCPNSGTGSGPGADAASGKDAEAKDSTIHDTGADATPDVGTVTDAAKGSTDAMSGVMYGPATGDW